MVLSKIWIRCAEALILPKVSILRPAQDEESFEHACLAQPVKALPHTVPMPELLRQGSPTHILDREKMQRFQELAVIHPLRPDAAGRLEKPQAYAPNSRH
jgi:hypothetical protein